MQKDRERGWEEASNQLGTARKSSSGYCVENARLKQVIN